MELLPRLAARRGYLLAALVVLVVDQASKIAADAWLRGQGAVVVIPGLFNLAYSRNRGGLFGYFAALADPWRSVLLTTLPLFAMVLIAVFLLKSDEHERSSRIGLALILGGAAGNLLDRIVRGEVVDFLDVYASWEPLRDWLVTRFQTAHWPTFNVADSCICIGAGFLLVDILRPSGARRQAASGGPDAP